MEELNWMIGPSKSSGEDSSCSESQDFTRNGDWPGSPHLPPGINQPLQK